MKGALFGGALAAAAAAGAWAASFQLPQGPGVNLVYAKCQTCHDLQYVVDAKGLLPAQWNAVIASMKDYGMTATPEEAKALAQYLGSYLGPNPPPASSSAAAPSAKANGRQLFEQNCAACHGPEGAGIPGTYPPLAGNPDLTKDPMFPVLVVLNGITGPIEAKGAQYNGTMPPFGHLSNDDVAAIVNYVRSELAGAKASRQVTPQEVAAQRERKLSPQQVHDVRAKLS